MIVKLTYYGTNRPTLVNLNKIESIYQVYDRTQRRYSTKICFNGNNSFINVEEDLQTIMKLQESHLNGEYQSSDFETQSFDDRMEDMYYNGSSNRPVPQRPRYNEKNYNSPNAYNVNQI